MKRDLIVSGLILIGMSLALWWTWLFVSQLPPSKGPKSQFEKWEKESQK